jgi:hypothetical protein
MQRISSDGRARPEAERREIWIPAFAGMNGEESGFASSADASDFRIDRFPIRSFPRKREPICDGLVLLMRV